METASRAVPFRMTPTERNRAVGDVNRLPPALSVEIGGRCTGCGRNRRATAQLLCAFCAELCEAFCPECGRRYERTDGRPCADCRGEP